MNLSTWWLNGVLFAVDFESFFKGLGSEFRGRNARLGWQDGAIVLGIIAVVAVAVFALSKYLQKQERGERIFHPWKLFNELCRAHNIDFKGRLALRQLAKSLELDHPVKLFLDQTILDRGVKLPAMAKCRERLEQIQLRLFDNAPNQA